MSLFPMDDDARFMTAAIALARRGLGRTAPNPSVGALIVRDGEIVGRGWTRPGGRPHAETEALREAGDAAMGATLYVTLEPCSHHGRTPPCAEAIVKAGIARVVAAIGDPDERVAGRGYAILRAAGVALRTGVCEEAARAANLGHMLRVRRDRPMVTLKLALTADGYAGAPTGDARLLITGADANAYVHMQRAMHDAVMIGARTAAIDDPLLTVRLPGLEERRPLRVVLDSNLGLAPKSRLVQSARAHPTLVIAGRGPGQGVGDEAGAEAEARLVAAGVEVARVGRDSEGRVDLRAALGLLAAKGLTRIFCEGGPQLARALIAQDFADEVSRLTGAVSLGGQGVAGLDAASLNALEDPQRYKTVENRRLGADRLLRIARIF